MRKHTQGPPGPQARVAGGGLLTASFLGLLSTQLLSAINDNIFRWLVIGIGKDYVDASHVGVILTAGTACFVLPYLLLAAPAGYLADRYSKRSVIVVCKYAEIAIVTLGIGAIWLERIELLFLAVALIGAQSALFSPSKMGIIPEMLRPEYISAANGLFGLTTVSATVIGMGVGNWLSDRTGFRGRESLWLSALVLLGVALAGTALSLIIRRFPAADPTRRFPWNVAACTARDLRALAANRPLLRVALGIVFFWSVGALAQLNIDQFAAEGGALNETAKVPLLFALVIGVGVGSVLAGIWSAGRVELGILPLGALGMALASIALFAVQGKVIEPSTAWTTSFVIACGLLFVLGSSAGLFSVPLDAYMQHRSPVASRGSILAANNFLTFAGVLISSFIYLALRAPVHGVPLFNSRQVFLLAGFCTLPIFVYIVWLIPQASIRFLVWLGSRTVYRVRIAGREYLPEEGGALLVSNHVSWLDAVFLLLASSRPIRMIAWVGNFRSRSMRWLAKSWGVILMGSRPKEIVTALRTARQALNNGELVCIFPEGGITRSGQLQGFRPGMLKILQDIRVPVLPVYLDGLWGSIFSFERGRFFWKWPKRWPYPVYLDFGAPFENPGNVHRVRRVVQELGAQAVQRRAQQTSQLLPTMVRTCRRRLWSAKIADSTGAQLTGGQLLARILILRRLLRRSVLDADEQHVGVLLPPSIAGVVTNLTLAVDHRVSVNLNYTVSAQVLNACIQQAQIRHVLTSRRFMEKMKFELQAEIVCLEDFRDQATIADKCIAACQAYALPANWLGRLLKLHQFRPNDVLTVIFTSGSTGEPKGVMLTCTNVASNAEAAEQVLKIRTSDVLIGVLPFFHSMGYTITLWTVATINARGVYHFNPLDAKLVGKLCREQGGTILVATPTFLRTYLRRCEPDDFRTLDMLLAGAERLPTELCDAFEQKFGVRPMEGYGTTELSPLVSVNVPPSRTSEESQLERKEGTVGRPIPGVAAKVVHTETGEELNEDQPGMLLVTGPNVMKGYLGREDLTAQVMRDGWYVTGDIAQIDADGFLKITGRESRFSKIGGEMVPHIRIEEALESILGPTADESLRAAVTAIPDPKRGERLIVLHTPLQQTPDELCRALAAEGLPNLFIPSPDSFWEVEQLPILGSGKLDLKGLKQLALERSGDKP